MTGIVVPLHVQTMTIPADVAPVLLRLVTAKIATDVILIMTSIPVDVVEAEVVPPGLLTPKIVAEAMIGSGVNPG